MNNVSERFNYNNAQKTNKNFMYKDFRRSNCYNCDFSGSNFNFASFKSMHILKDVISLMVYLNQQSL